MAARTTIDADYARSLFLYDPADGSLVRKVRKGHATVGTRADKRNRLGYHDVSIDYARYEAHRIIWLIVYGFMPPEVDHKNRIRSDNRLVNLRAATHAENHQNKGVQANNTSGIRGVCFDRSRSKWFAYIKLRGRMRNLGLHDSIFEAAAARKSAENSLFTHL